MAELTAKLVQSVGLANRALATANAALAEFSSACAAHDWQRVEDARLCAIANMEAYLDGLAAVYKSLEGR